MRLERFQKNPVLLFNHNTDYPVGKVTKVEKRQDGVWCEAELSMSTNDKITYIRDLVADGTLKTFSFRFNEDAKLDGDTFTDWELQEVSIVSLPAQPDSVFSLRMAKNILNNCRTINEAREAVMHVRGAKVAKYVSDHVSKVLKAEAVTQDDLFARLRDASGLEAGPLAACIDGETTPVPEPFISACVEVLGCDKAELEKLNAEDLQAMKETEEVPAELEQKPDPESEEMRAAKLDSDMQECVASKIPVLIKEGKDQEQAVAMAISMCSEERGCAVWRAGTEQIARFLEVARQAGEGEEIPEPTVKVEPEIPNDNAMLQKLDSMVSLLGNLVILQKEVLAEIQLLKKAEVEDDTMEEPGLMKPEKKEDEESKETPEESEAAARAIEETFGRLEARLQSLSM
jgi:HK97 family phage prohead protease